MSREELALPTAKTAPRVRGRSRTCTRGAKSPAGLRSPHQRELNSLVEAADPRVQWQSAGDPAHGVAVESAALQEGSCLVLLSHARYRSFRPA